MSFWKNATLTTRIVYAMLLGLAVGLGLNMAYGVNGLVSPGVNSVSDFLVYGVFHTFGKMFVSALKMLVVPLVMFSLMCGVLGSLAVHCFVPLMILLKIFTGLSQMTFLRKIRPTQTFAFSTASSNATIPATLRAVTERIGVHQSVSSFTVPFGATINMDGTAIMQGVATVFIANVYGVELGLSGYLTVILMAVLASIGTAGVPGVGMVMLTMVLTQVGLPVEAVGLLLGVDRLMDMCRTAVNVTGDAVVSTIVAKGEGKLDLGVFDDPNAGVLTDGDLPHLDADGHVTS